MKGKYEEEPVRFDHSITVCIVNINDPVFTFERVHTSSTTVQLCIVVESTPGRDLKTVHLRQ